MCFVCLFVCVCVCVCVCVHVLCVCLFVCVCFAGPPPVTCMPTVCGTGEPTVASKYDAGIE